MKKLVTTLLICSASLISAQVSKLSALLTYSSFNTPDNKPYIETYLSVIGQSPVYVKNKNGKFQANIEVGIAFTQGNAIKSFKKYTLLSPELNDTLTKPSFIDQQRFSIDTGIYMLELSILDKNNPGSKAFSKKEPVEVNFSSGLVNLSGIQLVESYSKNSVPGPLTKNGYDLVPYIANSYPPNMDKLTFYSEIYNTPKILGEKENFVVLYYLETYADARKLDEFGGHMKMTSQPVNIVFPELSIQNLASGNYNLVVEVHDKTNKIVAYKKTFITRTNPRRDAEIIAAAKLEPENSWIANIKGKDSLAELIRSLHPISTENEQRHADDLISKKDVREMQKYLLNFWSSFAPNNPEEAFNKYNQQVIAVQHSYGTQILRGYNTDRGRVYLKYGEPNVRTQMDKEPSAYPYEIWTYYKLPDGQRNRKFVFYDPDLATNNYRLIHSDAIGEVYDANWAMKLRIRDTQSSNLDMEQGVEHFGGNSTEDYTHPK